MICPSTCPNRTPGCHDTCEEYIEKKSKLEKQKKEQREFTIYNQYKEDRFYKNLRRRH